MKIVPKFIKEIKELDVWDDDVEVEKRENTVREIARCYFRAGYDEMTVYRQLGLSTKEHWEWLRWIKENLTTAST